MLVVIDTHCVRYLLCLHEKCSIIKGCTCPFIEAKFYIENNTVLLHPYSFKAHINISCASSKDLKKAPGCVATEEGPVVGAPHAMPSTLVVKGVQISNSNRKSIRTSSNSSN